VLTVSELAENWMFPIFRRNPQGQDSHVTMKGQHSCDVLASF
jgi:hypothetical protein